LAAGTYTGSVTVGQYGSFEQPADHCGHLHGHVLGTSQPRAQPRVPVVCCFHRRRRPGCAGHRRKQHWRGSQLHSVHNQLGNLALRHSRFGFHSGNHSGRGESLRPGRGHLQRKCLDRLHRRC
jgi:hypothetical protein